jgi:tetratricopeptide (TPR) repeat protein
LGRWPKVLEAREGRHEDSTTGNKVPAATNSRRHSIVMLFGEKVPFVFLAIIVSIVTFWAQNKGAVVPIESLSLPIRVANALISYVSYLGKILWPVDLAVFYPYEYPFPWWQILASCFVLIGMTIFVMCTIKKLPFLFVGWFWYLGTLIPVIGLVQVGVQAMADRYTYLPSVGIAVMLVWGISHVSRRGDISRKLLFPAGMAILIILCILTWRQSGYWRGSIELFNHALRITRNNDQAHKNLASALAEEGKIEDAIDHYNTAIRLQPHSTDAFNNRGNIYIKIGQYYRAIEDYNAAIRLTKNDAELYYNRGVAYFNLGQYQHAIDDYDKAIAINPSDGENYNNRGAAFIKLGQYQIAIEDFNKAIKLKPEYPDAYSNRAFVYFTHGDDKRGCLDAQKACDMGSCNTWNIAKKRKLCN